MPGSRAVAVTLTAVVTAVACGLASGPEAAQGPAATIPAGWQSHAETAYGFAVSYPVNLAMLPETTPAASGAIKRIRFQDKQLLSTQFAEMEPPRLAIEVFEGRPPSTPLADWLRSRGFLPEGATTSRIALKGATDGIRVQLRQQLAPNDFFYFATAAYVYRLTPLGQYSSAMLASFQLL